MISEEVREFLVRVCTALNKHEVEYIIVGGAAVNYSMVKPFSIAGIRIVYSATEFVNQDGYSTFAPHFSWKALGHWH